VSGRPADHRPGPTDPIFGHIADHRAAAAHYSRCVDAENAAEESGSSPTEHPFLQKNSVYAFQQMMMFARAVMLCRPTTRRGLIHQARYLASQFNDPAACNSGG
jgi:hypothetical protein